MFFRIKKTPSGQVLQLIESYRTENGSPRQRLIISLGNAPIPSVIRPQLAQIIEDHLYGRIDLFSAHKDTNEVHHWADTIIRRIAAKVPDWCKAEETQVDGVLLDKIEHETVSELGPQLVGLHAWDQLGFDDCLIRLGFNNRQRHDAIVSVLNRLIASVSEHRLGQWLSQNALPELLGEEVLRQGDDHYYRISDKLLSCQSAIEAHIRSRQQSLFALDRSILLYDLTNTHFEGVCKRNPKAKHGKNKQKRDDCRQVVVGMVFDGSGFELGHKVFEGNKSDSKSLIDMIDAMDQSCLRSQSNDGTKPIVILDGGISSRKNLKLLRDNGYSYLVNDSRRCRITYADAFAQQSQFDSIEDRDCTTGVSVRLLEEEVEDELQFTECVVLCRSEARSEKERAIISKAEQRYLISLEKLQKRIREGKLVNKEKVIGSVGRLQGKHSRVRRYYDIEIVNNEKRVTDIIWHKKDNEFKRSTELFGCYVLRTDVSTLTKTEIWRLYMTLTRAEEGFQCLKRDLGLRPNRHHKEDRVDGHIFITVLAYQLMCYICRKLEENGDKRDWDTIRRVLRTHCYTSIILPTKSGAVYRIRKASTPEECQKEIYKSLGINWKNLPVLKTKLKR
jgi:transposase